MKPIRWTLVLLAGALVAAIAAADTPQPVALNVGPAASGGVVAFTLNAPDTSGATLNVQTLVAAGDSAAAVAAKIVASVSASGGVMWTAQASYGGVPGAVTFAYNPGSGYLPVIRVTNLHNTASAAMTLSTLGAADVSLVFNAGSSGGNQSTLTLRVGSAAMPFTMHLYGQTASAIVDAIQAYLANAGISSSRSSTNRIEIYPGSLGGVSFSTNDPGLQGQVTLSEVWLAPLGRGGTDK